VQGAATQGVGRCGERRDVEAGLLRARDGRAVRHAAGACALQEVLGQRVEDLAVGAEQRGGPRQGLRDGGTEDVGQHRQDAVADPGPPVRTTDVRRVVPGIEALGGARLVHHPAGQVQQRAPQQPAHRRHPGKGPGPRAAGQREQHGLGLVVQRVPEQDGHRPEPASGVLERRIASGPRRRLGPSGAADHDRDDLDGIEPERTALRSGPLGDPVAALLEPVVDDHSPRTQP